MRARVDVAKSLFEKYDLIGTAGNLGDENFTIILYPSLQFTLNKNDSDFEGGDFEENALDAEDETVDGDIGADIRIFPTNVRNETQNFQNPRKILVELPFIVMQATNISNLQKDIMSMVFLKC